MKMVRVLNVTVTGGGPVGLAFALKLRELLGDAVSIRIFDGRWMETNLGVVWKGENEGNTRRQNVVTIQSRQYSQLPKAVQNALFQTGHFTEMWPTGWDSPTELGRPRNMRIMHIEDQLLQLANEDHRIQLIAQNFSPKDNDISSQHVLAICEGASSSTREYFSNKFGQPDKKIYSLENHGDNKDPLQDMVLGLLVKSNLPDSVAVALTIGQNRFLLNSLNGDGVLNMRLYPDEVTEVVGVSLTKGPLEACIQSGSCMMQREKYGKGIYYCPTHHTYFKPALEPNTSPLWLRILDGLRLFGIAEQDLRGITIFRISMIQRPRFCAEIMPPNDSSPGVYGCLLGDAANAIHFWPGRGLNSGFASAFSLAYCLYNEWDRGILRDASFMRHEAMMAMLQYRHKTRAWRAMTAVDSAGNTEAIKDIIARSYTTPSDININYMEKLLERLTSVTQRLKGRLNHLPERSDFESLLSKLTERHALRVLYESGAWDTRKMGGDEADPGLLLRPTRYAGMSCSILPQMQLDLQDNQHSL
jgi:hypothetical protein